MFGELAKYGKWRKFVFFRCYSTNRKTILDPLSPSQRGGNRRHKKTSHAAVPLKCKKLFSTACDKTSSASSLLGSQRQKPGTVHPLFRVLGLAHGPCSKSELHTSYATGAVCQPPQPSPGLVLHKQHSSEYVCMSGPHSHCGCEFLLF